MLLVTYGCNLRCTYCYEPKKIFRRVTPEKAKRYVSDCINSLDSSYTEFEVQFMGGEPLLEFPMIREVSEWLWAQDWRIPLKQIFAATNGTLLNEEMRQWITPNKHRFCLGLSFDGNRLMQNMNRTNSYFDVDLAFYVKTWPNQSVKMTISPDTIGSLFDGVMHLYDRGFQHISADLAMGANVLWQTKHLSEFENQLSKLVTYYLEHPHHPIISLLDIDVTDVLYSDDSYKKHCSCGDQLTCIDVDGTEYACHLFSPIAATLEQSKESLSINFMDYDKFESEQCRMCLLKNVCTKCAGMNYNCNGDISKPSAITCTMFKVQFAMACYMQLKLAETQNNQSLIIDINNIIKSLN